jgi:hypothetical protein
MVHLLFLFSRHIAAPARPIINAMAGRCSLAAISISAGIIKGFP